MKKIIDKVIWKIRNITGKDEQYSVKVLAAITAILIAGSWFVMGSFLGSENEIKISKQELQEQREMDKLMQEYENQK